MQVRQRLSTHCFNRIERHALLCMSIPGRRLLQSRNRHLGNVGAWYHRDCRQMVPPAYGRVLAFIYGVLQPEEIATHTASPFATHDSVLGWKVDSELVLDHFGELCFTGGQNIRG